MVVEEPSEYGARRNARLYVLVAICEVIVIAALWMLGRIYR